MGDVAPRKPADAEQEFIKVADTKLIDIIYDASFKRPELYRARSQSAFTISTSAAAALGLSALLGSAFQGSLNLHVVTRALLVIAVIVWATSATLAVFASSYAAPPDRHGPKAGADLTMAQFRSAAIERGQHEAEIIGRRAKRAVAAVCTSVVLTVVLLLTTAFLHQSEKVITARATFSPGVEASLTQACNRHFSPVDVRVKESDLNSDLVKVELPAGQCGVAKQEIAVPKAQVELIKWPG